MSLPTHTWASRCHTHAHVSPTHPHAIRTAPSGLINPLWVNYASCPLPGRPGRGQHVISPTFMNRSQRPTRGSWEAGGCRTRAPPRVTGDLFTLGGVLKMVRYRGQKFHPGTPHLNFTPERGERLNVSVFSESWGLNLQFSSYHSRSWLQFTLQVNHFGR